MPVCLPEWEPSTRGLILEWIDYRVECCTRFSLKQNNSTILFLCVSFTGATDVALESTAPATTVAGTRIESG